MQTSQLAAVAAALPDGVVVVDGSGAVRWANAAAERLVGQRAADWVGANALSLLHPDDVELALLSLGSVQQKEVGTPIELRLATPSGWRLVELVGSPIADGELAGSILLSLRDLTERRRWEVAGDDAARFRSLVHNAASVTMLVAPDGTVSSVSGAITRFLGHDPEIVCERPLTDVVAPPDRPVVAEALARSIVGPSSVTVEARLLRRDASADPVPFELTIVNLLDDPTVAGLVVSGHDITRLRTAQDALEHLANHDALTGLANRAGLTRRLAAALADRAEHAPPLFVAFVDIDRFKPVNDLLGHDVGDELLVALAERLRDAVRRDDLVARLGGDEFVVVAEVDDDDAAHLLARLEACVARPFELSVGPVHVQASIGLARAGDDHTTEALLADADAAMYSVKRARRGGPPEPVMSVRERRTVAEELASALARDELAVHYQPVVGLGDGEVRGYEALVRWNHPGRGLLAPGYFLGVAEDAGRDDEITEFVLRSACRDLLALGGEETWVSVNASGGQLASPEFADLVSDALRGACLAPYRLVVEVTERAIIERSSTNGVSTPVLAALDRLAHLGVRVAIDDFGTGYSSLTHIVQFPVQILKIDRSFVDGVGVDRDRHSVVAALVALARNLGVISVAEGIEEPRQLEALRRIGCDLGQGFLLGRPAPAAPLLRRSSV